jgi:hypothetical protein
VSAGFNRGWPVSGDIALTADGRDLQLVTGGNKIRQSIRIRCLIFKGSWRYDRNIGMPYFEDILVFGASAELIRRRFYDLLIQTDGVLSVQSLTLRFDQTLGTIFVDFAVLADTSEILRDTLDFQVTT